jgi:hypothetical protein
MLKNSSRHATSCAPFSLCAFRANIASFSFPLTSRSAVLWGVQRPYLSMAPAYGLSPMDHPRRCAFKMRLVGTRAMLGNRDGVSMATCA